MTAWMVLTTLEPYQKAVRSGLASTSRPWKPRSIPSPKLADPDVVCFVVVSKLGRPQLVAVLQRPEYAGNGFPGETNEVPLMDLTAKWFKLKFDDGGGNPGDATTALKVPRVLADADLKILGVNGSQATGPEPLPCVTTLVNPSPSELDASQQKQVVEAGVGYDARKLNVEQRLAASELDDGSFFGSLVIRRFEGAGAAYDVLTYMGDSGSIFRAGTIRRVGRIIQGGLQCDDPALAATLEVSLRAAPVAGE